MHSRLGLNEGDLTYLINKASEIGQLHGQLEQRRKYVNFQWAAGVIFLLLGIADIIYPAQKCGPVRDGMITYGTLCGTLGLFFLAFAFSNHETLKFLREKIRDTTAVFESERRHAIKSISGSTTEK
ncbi:hypothetical protein [Xanthobacter flavus]|uniref:hypothetical protein n=1 Tax=Xanthobacter flavus TaxID=281 RepID=UPI001AE8365D|nr:hypothetical protein [Xanthobacter flavus]MBP2147429.1 hypothetical protein [Xanthobacter flavus]